MRGTEARVQLVLEDAEMLDLRSVTVSIPASDPCTVRLEPLGITVCVSPPSSIVTVRVSNLIFADVDVDGTVVVERALCPLVFSEKGLFLSAPPGSAVDVSKVSATAFDASGRTRPEWVEVFGPGSLVGGRSLELAFENGRCCFALEVVKPSQVVLDLSDVGKSVLEDPEEDWVYGPASLAFQFSRAEDGYCTVYADTVDRRGQYDPSARDKIGFFSWSHKEPVVVEVSVSCDDDWWRGRVSASSSGASRQLRAFDCKGKVCRARLREAGFSGSSGAHRVTDLLGLDSREEAVAVVLRSMGGEKTACGAPSWF